MRLLGPRHPEVRRLRSLLRDASARAEHDAFVLEGPRVVSGALDRGAPLEALYLGTGAARAFAPLVERARASGAEIAELGEGVLEKVGRMATPQPVLGVSPRPRSTLDDLGPGLVLVGVSVADPGNAGTLIRSAEATGAAGVVFAGGSVDPFNPKVVRASSGAVVGVAVVVSTDVNRALDVLGGQGRTRVGAVAHGDRSVFSADWPAACAIVLGNEAHGLAPEAIRRLDGTVTIPMAAGESLNVAMAATVLSYAWMREHRR